MEKPLPAAPAAAESVRCACPACYCAVPAAKAVIRDGKVFCSSACAYECTEKTCVCVHERCEKK